MNRKKKKNIFLWKKGNFSFITPKKKKNKRFFKKNKCLLYVDIQIYIYIFGEKREGVYFKLKYL